MEGSFRAVRYGLLIVAAMFFLAACAGMQAKPAQAPREPAPQFRLASDGLAEKGMWKCTPLLFDVNKDGNLDVVAHERLGRSARIWLGDGKGTWTDASQGLLMKTGSCGGGVAVADINRDGYNDLAVADHCSGVYVYLSDGAGHWNAVTEGLYPPTAKKKFEGQDEQTKGIFIGAEDIALGDVNSDGFVDIVSVASDQGGFAVYYGDGKGKNWKHAKSNGLPDLENPEPDDEDNAGWSNRVLLSDVNGDGKLDVVAAYFKGPRVWLGDGKGHFHSASAGLPTPMIGGLYRGLELGDVNEDGLVDIVTANDVNGPEVYLQQPDGSWKFTGDVMPSMKDGAVGVALGDFSQSGHLDIVVGGRKEKTLGSNYGLHLLAGDGKGNFKEVLGTNLPSTGLSVSWGQAVGDVNNDGLPDILSATGGAVVGGGPQMALPKKASPEKAQKKQEDKPKDPTKEVVPELSLPRLQVWINEGVK